MKADIAIGNSPLLLAQPHGGIEIPEELYSRLNANGKAMTDTDWHITRLYADLLDDITIVSTPVHRYVIDTNRNPNDESLYPGQNTTGLCPTTTFDGAPIYLDGEEPGEDEIAQRQEQYRQPYHDALTEQLARIKQRHGFAILYDCHSIRSLVPYLFDGKLPDFNIGTNSGASCELEIQSSIENICNNQPEYTSISNGRFKGGWTTRHYGKPETGIHAIQMELAQCNYMLEQAPWNYQPNLAEKLRVVLKQILTILRNYG